MASVEALVTGDPEEDDTFCGAVNSKQHYQKVLIVVLLFWLVVVVPVWFWQFVFLVLY